jgi:putative chitobiose transport system substrate-binding protein
MPSLLLFAAVLLTTALLALWPPGPVRAQQAPGMAATVARPAPQTQQLVFWTMQLSPFFDDYVLGLISRFEAANPGVRIKWVDVPWGEMERKALASMAAGTAPDVLNLNPQFAARLAELGALADPREHLSPAQIAAYLPPAWAANQLGGKPFAVPWYLSTTVTLYHRGLLQRAGVPVPVTFEDLATAAQAVQQRTGVYAWFPAMDGAAPLEMLVAMQGALLSPDGCKPAFDSPQGVAAFTLLRDLYRNKQVPPTVLTEGHRSAVTQFLSGQVAMVSTGMQFMGQVKKNNPELYAQIGVAPQVTGFMGSASVPNIAAMNLAVPTRSANPKLAFAFAAFVTNSENQLLLVRRVPLLPSTRASYADPLFTQSSGDALLDQARAISVRQVQSGMVHVPPLPHYNKLRTSFVRQIQSAMAGKTDPAVAVANISRTWQPLLGCKPQ